ncbi:unnamed protein product [Thelazia callipaeda]|uniref:Macro domain-containing protein n=1 Tax=Thelazia callipaeda TaxID=103827 RepID=A0A0N5CR28_THECL|nr:unnamed protein product [Thelazia callipaeda]
MADVKKWTEVLTAAELIKSRNPIANHVAIDKGDITKLEVDAIVNAANSSLLGGGGVDGAIHRAAGRALYEECKKLNGCRVGEAKITKAYNLKHIKHIIHTVGPQVHSQVTDEQRELLKSCYIESLELAVANNLRTVAFPCISTGVYGYPNDDACNVVISSVLTWLESNKDKMDKVIFVTFLDVDYELYKKYLKEKMALFTTAEQIVNLNVGGHRFATTRHTLTWIPDTFFTSLLSGRIPTVRDETGAFITYQFKVFIDRDPEIFRIILNYLRTKQIDLSGVSLVNLKHEAQYYGLGPLVKRLTLCEELDECGCGDVLFNALLPPPTLPLNENHKTSSSTPNSYHPSNSSHDLMSVPFPSLHFQYPSESIVPANEGGSNNSVSKALQQPRLLPSMEAKFQARLRVPQAVEALVEKTIKGTSHSSTRTFLENHTSYNEEVNMEGSEVANLPVQSGSIMSGNVLRVTASDIQTCSADVILKSELSLLMRYSARMSDQLSGPLRVRVIRAHNNSIAVGYANFVCCYRSTHGIMKESLGWQQLYMSPRMDALVRHVALYAKFGEKMLAVALSNNEIHLWNISEDDVNFGAKIGMFTLLVAVDKLFFIGSQLVALSKIGKVGIWHSMTHNWQVQDVVSISCYDTAGSFLLLGCTNGSIYYIDMQKFPLRMKDNDLLITELYRDPKADVITAISVYLTPKTNLRGNWIEIAYGTSSGSVRVIVQHPETVGHGPQLFQTYTVHTSPVTRVALTANHLISGFLHNITAFIEVCGEYNHVRSWGVTRFRGMISTQPGSTSLASFKVLTLDSTDEMLDADGNDPGTYFISSLCFTH